VFPLLLLQPRAQVRSAADAVTVRGDYASIILKHSDTRTWMLFVGVGGLASSVKALKITQAMSWHLPFFIF